MIGVFYRAPEPGAPPFVEVGDPVAAGQTLCLLEAMKLFNELKSESAGVVRAIHVENGEPVEFGQLLFELEPLVERAARRAVMLLPGPRREPRRGRGARDPRAARARDARRSPCTRPPTRTRRSSAWPTARCASARPRRRQSYLSIPSLIAAATTTGCEAVHPGWGFLAENPAFARACEENDLVFIGPTPDVMARMGDKAQAKHELRAAGVPLVPGTEGTATVAQARAAADELGYPVLLKAAAGGGGKGMRLVESQESSRTRSARPRRRRRRRSATRALYVEKVIDPARHVEIQVLADARRRRAHARRARVLDPAPAPEADRGVAVAGADAGARARRWRPPPSARCATIGYRNAGTFEFLVGPDGSFYFIELNARLQVEHPVSELVHRHRHRPRAAADRRRRAALGRPAGRRGAGTRSRSGSTPRIPRATSRRRRASFAASGRRSARASASTPRVEDGSVVPPYYDSLIAKVIVWDADRPSAIARAIRALGELEVDGVPTTRDVALEILQTERVRGAATTRHGFLEDLYAEVAAVSRRGGPQERAVRCSTSGTSRASSSSSPTRTSTRARPSRPCRRERAAARRADHRRAPRAGRPTGSASSSATSSASRSTSSRPAQVPAEVAIDEAVTLAKRYASEDAGRLVNGILGRVAREEAAMSARGVAAAGRGAARSGSRRRARKLEATRIRRRRSTSSPSSRRSRRRSRRRSEQREAGGGRCGALTS